MARDEWAERRRVMAAAVGMVRGLHDPVIEHPIGDVDDLSPVNQRVEPGCKGCELWALVWGASRLLGEMEMGEMEEEARERGILLESDGPHTFVGFGEGGRLMVRDNEGNVYTERRENDGKG